MQDGGGQTGRILRINRLKLRGKRSTLPRPWAKCRAERCPNKHAQGEMPTGDSDGVAEGTSIRGVKSALTGRARRPGKKAKHRANTREQLVHMLTATVADCGMHPPEQHQAVSGSQPELCGLRSNLCKSHRRESPPTRSRSKSRNGKNRKRRKDHASRKQRTHDAALA